ncbi:hypothetical protein EVAR_27188_1 [Eumeta japonica]|uniref:Pre-C2HC domain-containing protein n=1 Tax=Eumeta variegata TaxID=151549 RepID=A0A4C1W0I5_EUMVA|nr:hypothetical protein EVAR_27188_1 [Eumeta japonica]
MSSFASASYESIAWSVVVLKLEAGWRTKRRARNGSRIEKEGNGELTAGPKGARLAETAIFHTYALEEERKIKAVLRNIPLEISTDCIKSDLESQNYPVFAVHRMHRRDGTVIGHVLAVLHKSDTAKDIFKSPPKVCGLSELLHSPAVSNAEPHSTKECKRSKTLVTSQSVLLHSEGHPASYKGCPKAPHFFKNVTGNKKVTSKPSVPIINNKIFPPWPGKPRDVTRSFAPATNAWSEHPRGRI